MVTEATPPEGKKTPTIAAKQAAKAGHPRESSGLEMVLLRNNFYRDNFRRLMVVCLLMIAAIIVLAATIIFLFFSRPSPTYFATTQDGRLFQMEPMTQPYLTEVQLNQWVVEAAVSAYSYNFVNYQQAIQEAKQYFTPNGYRQLLKALTDSRNLEAVREKKLVSSAVATGAPIILNQGILNDRYTWRIQLPMKVTYQSANELIPQNIIVTMLVTRVPAWESARGVGIESFIVREGRLQ